MPLTDAQKLAIEFVEFVWSGDEPGGAVLDGSSGSGKTLVTCSLLWQNRELGPQLLVCSPARLVSFMFDPMFALNLALTPTNAFVSVCHRYVGHTNFKGFPRSRFGCMA
jgi:hypothetical protein